MLGRWATRQGRPGTPPRKGAVRQDQQTPTHGRLERKSIYVSEAFTRTFLKGGAIAVGALAMGMFPQGRGMAAPQEKAKVFLRGTSALTACSGFTATLRRP